VRANKNSVEKRQKLKSLFRFLRFFQH